MTSREIDAGALEKAKAAFGTTDNVSAGVRAAIEAYLAALPSPSVDEAFNEGVEAAVKAIDQFCSQNATAKKLRVIVGSLKRPAAPPPRFTDHERMMKGDLR